MLPLSVSAPLSLSFSSGLSRLAEAMTAGAELYREDRCNENAAVIVNHVMLPEERQAANVLIFTHVRAKTPELYWRKCFLLRPQAASLDKGIGWAHHTVVLWGGGVYDFDYRGCPGTPLGAYAADMFGEGIAHCVVREIPAEEYAKKFRTRDMIFGENYPRYPLSGYLASKI